VVSHVGDYPITASGAMALDYAISYLPGSLTVTPAHVTINQAADQTDPTNRAPIHFTAVFQEPVSDFTAGSLALEGTAPGPLAASASPLGSDGTTYDVAVDGMKGTGTVTVGPAAGNGDLIVTSTDNTVTYRPWQNIRNPMDVNDQGGVTPLDVLLIINYINAYGAGPLPTPPPSPGPPPYVDVDGDGQVTAQDVLAVINYINSQNAVGTVQPEGESASRPVSSPVASPLGWQSQVVASDTPPALTPAITQRPSEMGGLTTPSATQGVPFSLVRTAAAQSAASPDIAAALQQPATSQLRSAEWETLLDCLAERGTRRGNRPDQVDQVFTELAADLAPG
jgi:Dockerin type I domain